MGLRKDHKDYINNDPVLGPKLRPLCPANLAPNAPLANLMATICKGLADEIQNRVTTEVISTEEMMYSIGQANKKVSNRLDTMRTIYERDRRTNTTPPIQEMNKTCVVSMDVSALYPSISVELAIRSVQKAIKGSNLKWENINTTVLKRYVAMTHTIE